MCRAPHSGEMAAMTRFLLAPLRSLALVALAAAGFILAMASLLGLALVLPYAWVVVLVRNFADLGRRLVGSWGGGRIESRYLPIPAAPPQRADRWYMHQNQLYKSPRIPAFM